MKPRRRKILWIVDSAGAWPALAVQVNGDRLRPGVEALFAKLLAQLDDSFFDGG
jgi:hypothetical protein